MKDTAEVLGVSVEDFLNLLLKKQPNTYDPAKQG